MLSHNEISELISNSAEGLPYTVKALVLELTKSLDIESGIIEVDNLQRLVRDMWVERVQGRKVEEIKKETIRSYLRTMHKCSRGLIQVTTSKDKKIQVFFPLVKKAYENFVAQNKEYSDTSNNKNKENLGGTRAVASQATKTDTTQRANSSAPKAPINKIINKNINKKISMWLEFEPTEVTVETSMLAGYSIEFIQTETQRFIKWNLNNNSQYTVQEWQEIFIVWLSKTSTYNELKQINNQPNTRKTRNAQRTVSKKQYKSTVDEVYANIEQFNQRVAAQAPQSLIIDESFFEARDF